MVLSRRIVWMVWVCTGVVFGGEVRFPTANRALLEPGGEERFFVGTIGRSWESGMFGCVRSDGWQIHEGIDIRCVERDREGEPTDPVNAAADGSVAYINDKAGLSNYGNYVVLRHRIDGVELYSVYAHLREIQSGIRVGNVVAAGSAIGWMGRTTNTRERISKDRAHVHFELNLFVNDRFPAWYKRVFPGQRNDHGPWNGQNMIGLDPRLVLMASAEQGDSFNLLDFVRKQPELCRVEVRDTSFPWLRRYTALVKRNPTAEREGVAGYEIALNYNGLPFRLIPRSAREMTGKDRVRLISVNEPEYQRHPCRKLIAKRQGTWELTQAGLRLIDLLTYK